MKKKKRKKCENKDIFTVIVLFECSPIFSQRFLCIYLFGIRRDFLSFPPTELKVYLECLLKAFRSALIRHVPRGSTNGSRFNTLINFDRPEKQEACGREREGQKTNTFDKRCFYGPYQSCVIEHVSRWFTVCAIITFKSN